MAKNVTAIVKLQIPAGKANPAPPIGPALGQHGVNIMGFCNEFNSQTKDKGDLIIPAEITIYEDRSFTFVLNADELADHLSLTEFDLDTKAKYDSYNKTLANGQIIFAVTDGNTSSAASN